MGKWKRGTVVPLEMTVENKSTLQRIDVSNVSLYIEKDETKTPVAVSHVLTGLYRGYWQTELDTELGKYEFKFIYTYKGRNIKSGVLEVEE